MLLLKNNAHKKMRPRNVIKQHGKGGDVSAQIYVIFFYLLPLPYSESGCILEK